MDFGRDMRWARCCLSIVLFLSLGLLFSMFASHCVLRVLNPYAGFDLVLTVCKIEWQLMPEHILPWLVFLIVNHTDYLDPDEDSNQVWAPRCCITSLHFLDVTKLHVVTQIDILTEIDCLCYILTQVVVAMRKHLEVYINSVSSRDLLHCEHVWGITCSRESQKNAYHCSRAKCWQHFSDAVFHSGSAWAQLLSAPS